MAASHPPARVLVVGGGLAGLFCALSLAPMPVTVLTGAPLGEGASSSWAQGGIAAAMADGDSAEDHARDTVAAGGGIVDEAVALSVAREAGDRVRDLLAYGVPFDRDLEGRLVQSREAAHGRARIVRVGGDMAGRAIMRALVEAARATPSIALVEGFEAEDLVMREGRACGVLARGADGGRVAFMAGAVVLATGGIGHAYAVTTNPVEARGAGLAIGARAGAVVADAEFVQFHPTALDVGRDPAPLATEALRGEGATLVDAAGRRFMLGLHPDAELAPRDIVARAVFAEVAAGRGAFLDARAAIGAAFPARFPTVAAACAAAGVDPVTMPIPIAPAEHYHMGGLETDGRGRTSVAGLWAAGEVASTGLHGANRLASNSLLEAVVMAARVARDVARLAPEPPAAEPAPAPAEAPAFDATAEARLRDLMARKVGVVRDGAGLAEAVEGVAAIRAAAGDEPRLRNMATAAFLVATAASLRRESRGGHFRSDFPDADPAQARRSTLTLRRADVLAREPVA